MRNGAARSIPATSCCPISSGVGYANEHKNDSMLCMSFLRETEIDAGGMTCTRCARRGTVGTDGAMTDEPPGEL